KQFEQLRIAVDVSLVNLPIVDTGKSRLARVADRDSLFELLGVDVERLSLDSISIEMHAQHTTEQRRVVILKTSRHLDHRRLNVRRDRHKLPFVVTITNETIQRANTSNRER